MGLRAHILIPLPVSLTSSQPHFHSYIFKVRSDILYNTYIYLQLVSGSKQDFLMHSLSLIYSLSCQQGHRSHQLDLLWLYLPPGIGHWMISLAHKLVHPYHEVKEHVTPCEKRCFAPADSHLWALSASSMSRRYYQIIFLIVERNKVHEGNFTHRDQEYLQLLSQNLLSSHAR